MALMRTNTIFLFIFILINTSKSEGSLEEKYYFQLFPSESKEKPFLFHAYTPNSNFITVNSTEGETCKILENKTVNEYPIKDLSSVIVYNKSILIKTCFGPDSIVEITDEKNETFYHKNNNIGTGQKSLDKLKFCYSTAIFNPLNKNEYAIMTYWTDFIIEKGIEKYVHKCIIFDPKTKTFSQEKVLTYNSNLIERLINNNYYAKSCITFRATDIFCSINLDSDTSYANSFIIDTAKIYSSEPQINLIFSNKEYGENIYQKPVAIGKEIHDIFGGLYDAFLTEYHDKENDKIILVSSLFRKSFHLSFISLADKSKIYYGINVEDSYIDQNLFNHLLPNENDLIVIYTMKTRDGMGLLMTRFNLTTSITYHKSFKEYSLSNYLREDICSRPRHIQSIFVNSFINYNERDKSKINIFGDETFYKYQKDIVTLLACEDDNQNVFYQSKKIIMPQCLNVLDEINNKDFHYIKYKDDENNVTLDIYNDPNLLSLRNITIEFLPIDIKGDPIIIMVKTEKTNYTYINHTKTNIIVNPTYIRIFRTKNFDTKEALELPYRLKQTSFMESAITCHLSSDICKFELIKINDDECNIDYCIYCETNICKKCKSSIEGILLDNKNNRCVCDINNGFKLYPQTFYSNYEMCICEENYSFYKNISLCRPNIELNNGSYYKDRTDDVSLIPIYDDCPKDCENCQVKNTTDNKKTFICQNGNEIEITDEPFITELPEKDDICLDENKDDKIWFEYEEHKFYYAKIDQCVYIIYSNSLFFYSNKTDCIFSDSVDTEYISKCLNIFKFNDYDEYKAFIEDSKEYNPKEESITIYRRINNFNFHLVNGQKSNDFSELEISPECENKLKDFYQINYDLKLLVFKVDITQESYLVTQVEYSFYNPDPRKIYEQLDLYKCSLNENETEIEAEAGTETERKLNNEYPMLKLSEAYILYPINLTESQRQSFEEIKKYNTFLFDSNEDFYNDVCFKFTTLKKNDMYIDDRRKNYYIYNRVCSPNCTAVDFNLETDNIKCQCPLKYEHQLLEEITDIENPFKEKVIAPNLQVLKCPKQAYGTAKNFGFFFNFILGIAFLLLFIYRKCYSIPTKFKLFYSILEKEKTKNKKEEIKNLLEEEVESDDDDFPHKVKPKAPPANEKDDLKKNDKDDDELQKEEVSIKDSTHIAKHSIKNKKRNIENKNNEDVNDEENKKIKMNPKQEESKIKASVINMNNNVIKGNNDSEDPKDDEKNININNNNLIDLSRNNIENKSKSSEKEKEEEGKSEVKSKKEKKSKRKRRKSKKNLIEDSEVNSDGRDDENEKQTKKRKKSKSKSKKKKKKLKEKENNENNSESEDEKDKKKDIDTSSNYTEGAKRKKEQNNENYDKDKEIEYPNINAIIIGRDKKITNNLFDNDSDENDEDMNYNLDSLESDKEKKSERNNKDNKSTKKKKKKKKKNSKNPANPPKNEESIKVKNKEDSNSRKDQTTINSDKKEIKEEEIIKIQNSNNNMKSSRVFLNNEENKPDEGDNNKISYLLDNLSLSSSKKKDKRELLEMCFSLIKNNNTLFYIFLCDYNDLFAKGSVLILAISFYLFINIIIMLDSSLLHLYTGRDESFGERLKGSSLAINIFIPPLMYIFTSLVKKRVSLKEFIYDKMNELREITEEKKIDERKKIIRIHDIKTDISKFRNVVNNNTTIIFVVGLIFLIVNWYVSTCFCGIYENSVSCLITNTLMSIFFSIILTTILFIVSAFCRYLAIKKGYESAFCLHTILNPSYLLYANEYRKKSKEKEEKNE